MKPVIAILLVFVVYSTAINPGIRFRMTDKLLKGILKLSNAFKDIQMKQLTQSLKQLGSIDEKLPAGTQLTNIQVKEHVPSNPIFRFAPPNELQTGGSGDKLVITFDVTSGGESGKGTFTLDNVVSEINLAFKKSASNKLELEVTKCNFTIGVFDVTTEGLGATNAFVTKVNEGKAELQTMLPQLCSHLTMFGAAAGAVFESQSMEIPIERVRIDMTYVNAPVATNDYIQFDHNGNTLGMDRMMSPPYEPSVIPDNVDNSRMFYVWVTEETINTFLREYHENGGSHFKFEINQTSTGYDKAQAALKKLSETAGTTPTYNGADEIEMVLRSAAPPVVSFKGKAGEEAKENQASFVCPMELKLTLRPGQPTEKVFSAKLTAEGKSTFKLTDTAAEEIVPKWEEKVEIASLKVDDVQGLTIAEDKKAAVTEEMRTNLEKFINDRIASQQAEMSKDVDVIKKMAAYGKVNNAYVKINGGSMELAFDIYIDIEKMKTEISKHIEQNS